VIFLKPDHTWFNERFDTAFRKVSEYSKKRDLSKHLLLLQEEETKHTLAPKKGI